MTTNFPQHPDQLTTDWLTQVLGYPVNDFNVTYFSEGTGVMSWVMRLNLDTPAGKPDSLIAKFPSPSEVNRDGANLYDMYQKEVSFYQRYVNKLAIQAPQCYFSAFEPANKGFVILLEDLEGWQIGDQIAGCNLEEAKAVIRALARFHASGWQAEGFAELPSHGGQQQIDGMTATYPIGWPVVLEQFGEEIPESIRLAAAQIPAHIADLLATMCQAPVCVTHADMRLDNIFFKDGDVTIVDWQSICTSAPEQDLAYFLTQSVPEAVRGQEDLVAFYHSELTQLDIDYDLEACRQRYVVCALYLICYAVVIAGTLDLGNERGRKLGETIVKNTFRALLELDAFSLIQP
jgi:hypothetical protein